jgi:hypothetical protein
VFDNAGNSLTATQDVTVTDNESPSISTTGTVTAINDAGQCKATVNLSTPTTADNCAVSSVSSDAPGNSSYNVGTTTVNWTVTDIHGNTNTTTQDVVVIDEESPVILSPSSISVSADAGQCEASVTVSAVSVTDNCSVSTVTNDYNGTSDASGTYPLGATTVTWTATDIHGNSSTTTQSVTAFTAVVDIVGSSVSNTVTLCVVVLEFP